MSLTLNYQNVTTMLLSYCRMLFWNNRFHSKQWSGIRLYSKLPKHSLRALQQCTVWPSTSSWLWAAREPQGVHIILCNWAPCPFAHILVMPLRQVSHQVRQLSHHFDHPEKVLMDSLGAAWQGSVTFCDAPECDVIRSSVQHWHVRCPPSLPTWGRRAERDFDRFVFWQI